MGSELRCKEYPLQQVVVRPSEVEDAHVLAGRLAPGDEAEVRAAGGEPLDALYMGIRFSKPCYTILHRGVPLCVFGVVGGVAPWMLGAPWPQVFKRLFLREGHAWLSHVHGYAPFLRNIIDARQVDHIRWLLRLGFTIEPEPLPLGINGETFFVFWRQV